MLGLRLDQQCYVIVHVGKIRVRVIGFNYQDHAMWQPSDRTMYLQMQLIF